MTDRSLNNRLRHEKLMHTELQKPRGAGALPVLRCYDLTSCPQPEPPQLKLNKSNPFDFHVTEDESVGA